jgi:hypothetical protein
MASARDVKVGSRDWVVRHNGRDVEVEVLSKRKKESGRGWEFKLKNLESGRTLTRGSGSLRQKGEPPRKAPSGFGKKKSKSSPPKRNKPKPRRKPRAKAAPKPPASDPFSSPSPFYTPLAGNGGRGSSLPSLRGRKRPRPVKPKPPKPPKQPKHRQEGYKHELGYKIAKALKPCENEWQIRDTFTEVMSQWNLSKYGIYGPPRR